MSNLIKHIALVSQTSSISLPDVLKISAALQKQISRDFSPIWNVSATIDAFQYLADVPLGYWPIIIRDDIKQPGAAGIHLDRDGQPYALVQASQGTPITCSHELLEMLVDPFGNRFVVADSIKPGQGRVRYLVEVCDPSEAPQFGYTVNGILLSDFYTPRFFDPVISSGIQYSFTGAITRPKEVLKGGYLSWNDPLTNKWWQATFMGSKLSFGGPYNWSLLNGKSWREVVGINSAAQHASFQGKKLTSTKTPDAVYFSQATKLASRSWSRSLAEDIESLLSP